MSDSCLSYHLIAILPIYFPRIYHPIDVSGFPYINIRTHQTMLNKTHHLRLMKHRGFVLSSIINYLIIHRNTNTN